VHADVILYNLRVFKVFTVTLLKVSTAKLKKFEKEYSVMKEQEEDPLERLQVLSPVVFCTPCGCIFVRWWPVDSSPVQHGRFVMWTVHHMINLTPVDSSQNGYIQL